MGGRGGQLHAINQGKGKSGGGSTSISVTRGKGRLTCNNGGFGGCLIPAVKQTKEEENRTSKEKGKYQ